MIAKNAFSNVTNQQYEYDLQQDLEIDALQLQDVLTNSQIVNILAFKADKSQLTDYVTTINLNAILTNYTLQSFLTTNYSNNTQLNTILSQYTTLNYLNSTLQNYYSQSLTDQLFFNKTEINQLLTSYYTTNQTYNKVEIDQKFLDEQQVDLTQFYTKSQIDQKFIDEEQIDMTNFFTKTEINTLLNSYPTLIFLQNNYYNKSQIDVIFLNYYDKNEINTILQSYVTLTFLTQNYSNNTQLNTILQDYSTLTNLNNNFYNKAYIDSLITNYATLAYLNTNFYTKTNIDTTLQDYSTLTNLNNNFYNKTEINNTLANYYTQNLVYNKAEIDQKFITEEQLDLTNFYTKAEINQKFIDEEVTDMTNYYLKTQIDSLLNSYSTLTFLTTNYSNNTQLNTILNDYATLTYLNSTFYTKLQIDNTLLNYITITYLQNNYYDKVYIDNNIFTKTETNNLLTNYVLLSYLQANYPTNNYLTLLLQNYVTNTQLLTNYYNQTEINDKLNDYYTKGDIDIKFLNQLIKDNAQDASITNLEIALSQNYYTKSEVDDGNNVQNTQITNLQNLLTNNYYDKTYIDNLNVNVDLSNYYNKSEVDNLNLAQDTNLNNNYYNKTFLDNNFATFQYITNNYYNQGQTDQLLTAYLSNIQATNLYYQKSYIDNYLYTKSQIDTTLLDYQRLNDPVYMSNFNNDLVIPNYSNTEIYFYTTYTDPNNVLIKKTEFQSLPLRLLTRDFLLDFFNVNLSTTANSDVSKYLIMFDNQATSDKKYKVISYADFKNGLATLTYVNSQLANYYTQTQINNTLLNYTTLTFLASNNYTKTEINNTLLNYMLKNPGSNQTINAFWKLDYANIQNWPTNATSTHQLLSFFNSARTLQSLSQITDNAIIGPSSQTTPNRFLEFVRMTHQLALKSSWQDGIYYNRVQQETTGSNNSFQYTRIRSKPIVPGSFIDLRPYHVLQGTSLTDPNGINNNQTSTYSNQTINNSGQHWYYNRGGLLVRDNIQIDTNNAITANDTHVFIGSLYNSAATVNSMKSVYPNCLIDNQNFIDSNTSNYAGQGNSIDLQISGQRYPGNYTSYSKPWNGMHCKGLDGESFGIVGDGNEIFMYSPADSNCVTYKDEDTDMHTANPIFVINTTGAHIVGSSLKIKDKIRPKTNNLKVLNKILKLDVITSVYKKELSEQKKNDPKAIARKIKKEKALEISITRESLARERLHYVLDKTTQNGGNIIQASKEELKQIVEGFGIKPSCIIPYIIMAIKALNQKIEDLQNNSNNTSPDLTIIKQQISQINTQLVQLSDTLNSQESFNNQQQLTINQQQQQIQTVQADVTGISTNIEKSITDKIMKIIDLLNTDIKSIDIKTVQQVNQMIIDIQALKADQVGIIDNFNKSMLQQQQNLVNEINLSKQELTNSINQVNVELTNNINQVNAELQQNIETINTNLSKELVITNQNLLTLDTNTSQVLQLLTNRIKTLEDKLQIQQSINDQQQSVIQQLVVNYNIIKDKLNGKNNVMQSQTSIK